MRKSTKKLDRELALFDQESRKNAEANTPDKIKFTPKDLIKIQPLTPKQKEFFELYDTHIIDPFNQSKRDLNIFCDGVAGVGKTMIAFYKALEEVIEKGTKEKIIIVRSVVETRARGFLPGTEEEKEAPFELPYIGICDQLINYQWRNYERLKKVGIIEFESTSNLRGVTWNDSVVIVDECQNMTFHELDTVITRIGKNSRIVFCGDFEQSDLLTTKNDTSGLPTFKAVLKSMKSFKVIDFGVSDIVRSGLVREYILAKLAIAKSRNSHNNKPSETEENANPVEEINESPIEKDV